MTLLKTVLQHGAVNLREQVLADGHDEVSVDAKDVGIEGGMVEFAQRQAVAHRRNAARAGVRKDVRRVEQLPVGEGTDGTASAVCAHDGGAEYGLMEASPGLRHDVPSQLFFDDGSDGEVESARVVYR